MSDDTCVTGTAFHNLSGGLEIRNFSGGVETVLVSVAELTIDTKSPSVHVTMLINKSRVLLSTSEVSDLTVGSRNEDLLGGVDFIHAAGDTKLAVRVTSKHIELAFAIKGHSVFATAVDFDDVFQLSDLLGHLSVRVISMTQLAIFTLAP